MNRPVLLILGLGDESEAGGLENEVDSLALVSFGKLKPFGRGKETKYKVIARALI